MSVPSQELNGFLRLSSDWVFGPRTEAGDAERGREEDRVRLDEERAGIHRAPSSHSIQPSLHHISMSLCQPLLLLHSVFKMVLPALFAAVEKQSVDNYHSV